jgi:hypothetical protein
MSNPFEYNYDNAILDVKLPEGWRLHFTFQDDSHCNFMNVIQLIDPENNTTDSLYDPTVCIFGPPFFLLNEALWIIDAIYKGSDPICTVPQIYALLLPITVAHLSYDITRTLIEQKYKCQLKGSIWNRISICPMTRNDLYDPYPIFTSDDSNELDDTNLDQDQYEVHIDPIFTSDFLDDFNESDDTNLDQDGADDGHKLDWDKVYPADPSLQSKYIHESWEEPLPQLIVGSFGIPMFPGTDEMYCSYRSINSAWMRSNNLDIFAHFLSLINMDFIKKQLQILYLYVRSNNINLNSHIYNNIKDLLYHTEHKNVIPPCNFCWCMNHCSDIANQICKYYSNMDQFS